MTTRPGNGALGLRNHRSKRLCNLVRIIRVDGVEMLWTDHDRKLSFEGLVYEPAAFTATSAEVRENAIRTPDQELHALVEGDEITLPDLLGDRYRGAEVWHVLTDWQYPWLPIARSYRTIRLVRWNGLRFIAIMAGVTQQLERMAGGRFGGVASLECPYVLGDPVTCKVDMTSHTVSGVTVDTVTDVRLECTFTTGSWTGSWADDYFRDGEIEWSTGNNAGIVVPINSYTHATRTVEFFVPTPFDIQAGDTGIARAGCDGLASTCDSKFSNILNFGGNNLQPKPGDLYEVAP